MGSGRGPNIHSMYPFGHTDASVLRCRRGCVRRICAWGVAPCLRMSIGPLRRQTGSCPPTNMMHCVLLLASCTQVDIDTVPTEGPQATTTSNNGEQSTSNGGSKKLLSVVVPITLFCIALIAGVVVYFRRKHSKLRSQYMRLAPDGGGFQQSHRAVQPRRHQP